MQTSNLEVQKKRNHEEEGGKQPEHLECPRCFSSNTKFCYYNNYNKSQPRHFCKGCKRHWTKGGTLRNVPLGGGRINKRQKLSNSASNKNHSTAPMTSSDPLIIFSQQVDNNNGTTNHFMGNNTTFLGGDHGMFFLANSQDQNNQFSCSEVGNFGSNLPSFAPKNHSLDAYGYTHMPDSSLESTITTTMPMDGCKNLSQKPFKDSFASGSMDLSSLWDWNEISSLVSADLNVPWDDSDIKF